MNTLKVSRASVALAVMALPNLGVVGASAGTATLVQLSAVQVANVPLKASELGSSSDALGSQMNGLESQVTVSLSEVAISGATVSAIDGSILGANGATLPFSLSGTLFRDPSGSATDGSLVDQTGTFSVLRFQIVDNASKGLFFTPAAKSSTGMYLAIYLEHEGTRDITFIEAPAATLLGAPLLASLEADNASFASAPAADTFWVEAMFTPDGVIHANLPGPVNPTLVYNPGKSAALPAVMPAATVRPLSSGVEPPLNNYPWYAESYYAFGATVYDAMELQEQLKYGPTTSSDVFATIYPIYEDFNNSNGLNLYYSDWEVGGRGPLGIKLTVPNVGYPSSGGSAQGSQRVQYEQVGGQLERSSSWSISYSFSTAFLGVSAALSYNNGGTVQLGAGANEYIGGDYEADMYSPSGDYMNYAGPTNGNESGHDNFNVRFTAPRYTGDGPNENEIDTVSWIYDMYNSGNLQNLGTEIDNLSFELYSCAYPAC